MDEPEDVNVATAEEPGRCLRKSRGWAEIGASVQPRPAERDAIKIPEGTAPFWEGKESFPRRYR
jgi:hypothetical protein